jgi:hypothetical protein
MKGSIRFIVGFLLVFGAVGGMENGTDAELPFQLGMAVAGLLIMYSGARTLKGRNYE